MLQEFRVCVLRKKGQFVLLNIVEIVGRREGVFKVIGFGD